MFLLFSPADIPALRLLFSLTRMALLLIPDAMNFPALGHAIRDSLGLQVIGNTSTTLIVFLCQRLHSVFITPGLGIIKIPIDNLQVMDHI